MFQQVTIVGFVGHEPTEIRCKDKPSTFFTVSVSERLRDKDGQWQNVKTWFDVDAFDAAAINCAKYVTKGSLVLVHGKMRFFSVNTDDGKKVKQGKLLATYIKCLNKNNNSEDYDNNQPDNNYGETKIINGPYRY